MSDPALHNPEQHQRRLHLHIPNSHPRATSPRSSPQGSPNTSQPSSSPTPPASKTLASVVEVSQQARSADDTEGQRESREEAGQRQRGLGYFQTQKTSGESSRDFLARERTYFSWLRLASLLAVAAVALFLRLRLKSTHEQIGTEAFSVPKVYNEAPSMTLAEQIAVALAKKALRRRQYLLAGVSSLPSPSPPTAVTPDGTTFDDPLDTNVVFSKVLGSLFFVLALIALSVGHFDYMRCERALEEADKDVTVVDERSQGVVVTSGSAGRIHSADPAKGAHSHALVHIVEIVIAMAVFATAIIILVTVTQGNIQPLPPGKLALPVSRSTLL